MEKLQMGPTNTRIGTDGNKNSLRSEACLATPLFCDMKFLTTLWSSMFMQNYL